MGKTTLRALAVLSALLLALLMIGVAPALAAGVERGDPSKTEDNDSNDNNTPNNVSDDGDNKHPSGKDRSVENGGSGNQGNSGSDPDDDGNGPDRSNGGRDKADGPGGVDKADQDGNNGCGNDDDFEDDNEGWCGPKPKPVTLIPSLTSSPSPSPSPSSTSALLPCIEDENMPPGLEEKCEHAFVPGLEEQPVAPGTIQPNVESDSGTPDSVLGERLDRAAAAVLNDRIEAALQGNPAFLPFTGGNVMIFVLLAVALIGLGGFVLRARRTN